MKLVIQAQIQNKADCVSLCSNALWKVISPSVLPSTMGLIAGHAGFFSLD